MERVLFTVIQGAVDYPDPIAQKTCFIILSKLVELWGKNVFPEFLSVCYYPWRSNQNGNFFFFLGGKDGPVGFADFVYKHIVPACFLAPLKQTFDLADAQTVLVCIMDFFFFLHLFLWGRLKLTNLQLPWGTKDCHLRNKVP